MESACGATGSSAESPSTTLRAGNRQAAIPFLKQAIASLKKAEAGGAARIPQLLDLLGQAAASISAE